MAKSICVTPDTFARPCRFTHTQVDMSAGAVEAYVERVMGDLLEQGPLPEVR